MQALKALVLVFVVLCSSAAWSQVMPWYGTPWNWGAARPVDQPWAPQYRLGVQYRSSPYGTYVLNVYPGSAAERVGLEPGDLLLEIDGIRLGYQADLAQAVQFSDGFVQLLIQDVRTGRVAERNVDLSR